MPFQQVDHVRFVILASSIAARIGQVATGTAPGVRHEFVLGTPCAIGFVAVRLIVFMRAIAHQLMQGTPLRARVAALPLHPGAVDRVGIVGRAMLGERAISEVPPAIVDTGLPSLAILKVNIAVARVQQGNQALDGLLDRPALAKRHSRQQTRHAAL
ncbi:hypothetical protein COA17_07325 [Sphingomonas ginsenosidimutans]|uniref:Uncharacterized protein n=1 Tax=Sphingomonas ginsenosidimutans TaxID=862134 RepID=A0A2A4I053_9SPHN|nr:hypothetical protein COA17_07325 [Sphingomonas ginsenosidimutans]